MHLARSGADSRPRVAEYCRAITCDLSRALLAAGLWELADASARRHETRPAAAQGNRGDKPPGSPS